MYLNPRFEQTMRFYLSFRICALINSILVISHIWETYPEDVRGQARLGGYNPATYVKLRPRNTSFISGKNNISDRPKQKTL